MKTINYSWTHKLAAGGPGTPGIPKYSHFAVEGVSFPLERLSENTDKDLVYTKCPVWSHKASRIFLVRSPIDFEMSFNTNEMGEYGIYWDPKKNNLFYDQVVRLDQGWNLGDDPVIQIDHPTLALWTKDKNIWYEVRPHPTTSLRNNFYAVGGWFNLSSWQRTSAFGMHVCDLDRPVKVKRGDVIFQICFYSDNHDDQYKLVEHTEIPEKEYKKMVLTANVKEHVKNFTKHLFVKQKESKCPFAFLFNK